MKDSSLVSVLVCHFLLTAGAAIADDPSPVQVGEGSYAASPPASADENRQGDQARDMDAWPIQVAPSVEHLPVPTNQWWTNVITRPFSGTIWPYPLAIRPEPSGVRIFFPIAWNEGGNDMLLERPLAIRADSGSDSGRSDIVVADFESGSFPEGWIATGEAFGSGPAQGPVSGQSPVDGYLGDWFVNSHHEGDRATGELISPEFTIERNRLQFLVGGGKDSELLGVKLLVDGSVVRDAVGIDRERPIIASWDIAEFIGKQAQIQIVDEAIGGWGHVLADHFVQTDRDAPPPDSNRDENTSFRAKSCQALRWGDWSLTLRMVGEQSESEYLDITVGRGMPYCWVDFAATSAVIETFQDATFESADGLPVDFPLQADQLIVAFPERKFAVFAPKGSVFSREGTQLRVQFVGALQRIAVSPLVENLTLESLAPAAMTPPLETRLSWSFHPESASVRTVWDLVLDGGGQSMIQGWLPHHYRDGNPTIQFDGPVYETPRGKMRCASGTKFEFVFRFDGIVPSFGSSKGIDTNRMTDYLTAFSQNWSYGGDTYWGGKDLLRAGQCLDIAIAIGESAIAEELRQKLHDALADWFTYSPGESEHYFARYNRWKALVGFKDSYGSFQFTDNHFHYGYFTMASALLALHDPEFLPKFGDMATLVAKQYANWDRSDNEFPFLRTFDIWEGHSNAGGFGGPNGNNQESSSEAMQSWAGLFLLGSALNNDGMRDAGAMGFAMERVATMQYWFNYSAWKDGPEASNWPAEYKHGVAGIVFSAGQAFATYFSGDPGWIYGIQWLPISSALDYLAIDPAFSKWLYQRMWEERGVWLETENVNRQREATEKNETFSPGENTISSIGSALGNVLLGYQLHFDPAAVVSELDTLWASNDAVGTDANGATVNYYLAALNSQLGPRQWHWHGSIPTSAVYKNSDSGALTFVAVNFDTEPVEVTFFENKTPVGTLTIPPHQSLANGQLSPIKQ